MPSPRYAARGRHRLLDTVGPPVLASSLGVAAAPATGASAVSTTALVRLPTGYLYRRYSKSDDRASVQWHAGACRGR